jgi:hypothetical protein
MRNRILSGEGTWEANSAVDLTIRNVGGAMVLVAVGIAISGMVIYGDS